MVGPDDDASRGRMVTFGRSPTTGLHAMSQIEILLPKMGESVAEATITKWLKKPGDPVAADEPIVEIATDKVDSEVPAPEAGVMGEQLVKEGDVVKVGQPIARIGSSAATGAPVTQAPETPKTASTAAANGHAPIADKASSAVAAPVERSGPKIGRASCRERG